MIREEEIDEKLKVLRGKVPNFLIEDLRNRLLQKKDILTPEQVERVVEKALQTYSGQVEKLSKLDRRVEEIGKYIEEIRNQLMTLTSSSSIAASPGSGQGSVGGVQPVGLGDVVAQSVQEGFGGPPSPETMPGTLFEQAHVERSQEQGGGVVDMQRGEEMPSRGYGEKDLGAMSIPSDIREVLLSTPRSRARLERIPGDMVSTMMALKWLGFLIERVGMQNLENVLDFYYQIGWISEDVLYTLLRYAEGIRPHHREPDWRPDEKLTIQDHMVSLLFIERLRGVRITRELLDSVEREMRAVGKLLEDIYGV